MKFDTIFDFYQREADNYDNRRWSSPAGIIVNVVQLKIVEDFTSDLSCRKCLEIGAGTGRFTRVLLEKFTEITACDISDAMLDKLRSRWKSHPRYQFLHMVQSDVTNMPFNLEFGIVLCINALSHIFKFKDVIASAHKALETNGIFLLNIPNYLSLYLPFGLFVNFRKKSLTRNVYTRWYSFREIKRVMEEVGFRLEEVKGQLHFPTWTPSFLLPLLKIIDKNFRNGLRARFAPIVFIKARKI